MGYTTRFSGELKFTEELTLSKYRKLQLFMGENVADHPEWLKKYGAEYSRIQFEITDGCTGIEWDGSEKFYHAVEAVNLILLNMRAEWPEFGLEGKLEAQGEDFDDRWVLAIEDDKAVRREMKIEGSIYRCPHCGGLVATDEAEKLR